MLDEIRAKLQTLATPERAAGAQRFFKTGKGEYGEGDKFLGVTVPDLRRITRELQELPLRDVRKLLTSEWHEERVLALLILVRQFERADQPSKDAIYDAYLRSTRHINNWDLVDCSAPYIVGAHLAGRSRAPLRQLAKSSSLWERRIAIIATLHFIRRGEFDETLRIAEMLVNDRHDLIHKAVGWMLREVGSRDRAVEERFLVEHAATMPRTMLRYAIEKFPEPLRRQYLQMGSNGPVGLAW
jgi:3-methyladenine DNA glycosylase AlkD